MLQLWTFRVLRAHFGNHGEIPWLCRNCKARKQEHFYPEQEMIYYPSRREGFFV